MKTISISIEYIKTVNYVMFHNGIPVCQSVEITNTSGQAIEDLKLTCEGAYICRFESHVVARINAGDTVRVTPFEVKPDAAELGKLTERVATDFCLTATSGGETLCEERHELVLMPYDHWLGASILPQSIVSFVTPNHPSVDAMVVKVADALKRQTGASALSAYQTGNVGDVSRQVAAVFSALHDEGIVYRSMPASYEDAGQRVTLPAQVLSTKIGNCLELTLLMASVLEAIGINCLVVVHEQHAYLGVWLVDDCYPCSVCDDAAFIEKKCSRGINEMLVVESTQLAAEQTSFEAAVKMAENNLADHSRFLMFVDVKRSRLEHFFPLPAKMETDGTWTMDTSGVKHEECRIDVREHDRYDLSQIAQPGKELTKFDIWERKLLDFSLRNSLLNLYLRRKAVQFISFDVDRIEDHLQDGEEYCISHKPEVEISVDDNVRLIRSKLYGQFHELISNDVEHHLLHTYQSETETRNVLKNIYRAARNAIEETGANSLFLAIGTLRWYETPQSETARYAPLLLLPVEMVYKKGGYYIRTRDEEISLNITLMEFLRQNFNISIDGLSPLPTDGSGVDVRLIFAIVRDALKNQKRWDVEEECLLGTFSFSKFLMWNDVHSHRQLLRENDIVNSLVENRLTWTPTPITEDLRDIDQRMSPAETALPVAVDSSQMAAVIEGGMGHSFILYGPPGTGKSQTITNLIANALYQGKRVLFVAEKMAALSVVQSRLAKIGLDPFCLELHSNKTTKRHVLQQLEKALKAVHIVPPAGFKAQADKIFAERKELISYMDALHSVDSSDGLSLYDCILHYESIQGAPLPDFRFDPRLDKLLQQEGIKGVGELLGQRFETVLKLVGQPANHPLNGLCANADMCMDTDGLVADLRKEADVLKEGVRDANSLRQVGALRRTILLRFDSKILDEDAAALRRQWNEATAKWLVPRFFAQRKFVKRMRQFNASFTRQDVNWLFDNLATYQARQAAIEQIQQIMARRFNVVLKGNQVPETKRMTEAIVSMERWADHPDCMRDWVHWSDFERELEANGMGCVVAAMRGGEHEAAAMRDAFIKALFKYKVDRKIRASRQLATFEGMLFDEKVATYKRMTNDFQLLTQKELYARLAARIPRVSDNAGSSSEIGLLNRNISNGGRGLSMRDLFDQLPTLLPRLCPCMLMSPMSVAQYIGLGQDKFDLVVFDEASQMPTSEAVGAIARGKSLIVVGDPKQMPPTSFFSSTTVDEEEVAIDDMESILEDCRTLEMPSLQLSWHYRSRHESLIAFSNSEYYDGSLITFPSVDDQTTKVHHVPVEGYYDKGGKRSNKAEAEAIVREIVRRLRDSELRTKSIGVIAFSVVQQSLIEDLLQDELDKDKTLHELAQQMYEPIFVKNLENVQGDERDVILFSVGYGPNKEGKVSMNFGPLNNAGGERRLNVAVSRAREEMYIFSTLKSSDIDLRRSKARGVEGLKHFLQYAETQSLPLLSLSAPARHDAVLAQQIAAELKAKGYTVATQVGRSQFKVDVAVCDEHAPGVYRLGILLDGEGYRDTHTTRDREVVQPSVLAALNWQTMRVWSVDWFNNKERVIARIVEKLEAGGEAVDDVPQNTFDVENEKEDICTTNAISYVPCKVSERLATSWPDQKLVREILSVEQPMTLVQLCRRICALRNSGRATQVMQQKIGGILDDFYKDEDGAVWINKHYSLNYPFYRFNSGRDIADIPQVELKNALCETLAEQLSLSGDELKLIAARKMGFSRRSSSVDAAFSRALETLVAKKRITAEGGLFSLASAQ